MNIRTKKDIVSMLTSKNHKSITIRSPSQNILTEHATDAFERMKEE